MPQSFPKAALSLLLLLLLKAWALSPVPEVEPGDPITLVSGGDPDCPGPPPGSRPVEYRVLLTQTLSLGGPYSATGMDSSPLPVRDREEIKDEAEYQLAFGKSSEGIDWARYRILVLELTTTYKLGALDSGLSLNGIYEDRNGIHVGITYTQYGPCQGIAQLEEWFSYARSALFILIPAPPEETLGYFSCIVGGCPPDIP